MSIKKFPRTPHLLNSLSASSDDKWITGSALSYLKSGIELVVTEKYDGGNYNMTCDKSYSRSIDSASNLWDTPAKALWANIRHNIPETFRLSGESMYAERSVSYSNLPGPFILFAIWDDEVMLSWDEMTEWSKLLELPVVSLLYKGMNFEEAVSAWSATLNESISEGFVIRDAGSIPYSEYGQRTAKWVRANHVRTTSSWRGRDDFSLNTFS